MLALESIYTKMPTPEFHSPAVPLPLPVGLSQTSRQTGIANVPPHMK